MSFKALGKAFGKSIENLRLTTSLLLFVLLIVFGLSVKTMRRVQGQTTVSTVSAASFSAALTPDGIASAFGSNLATQFLVATGQTLPTNLGGTTVQVNGQLAPLFFVSPNQVNYLIPNNTPIGNQTVVVTSGNGAVSNGIVSVNNVAPAIFTANASGTGFPAAVLLRIKTNGAQIFESVGPPIEFLPTDDRLFLILYLCGVKRAAPNTVLVNISGTQITPSYFGEAPGLIGLDQINLELPRSLSGRGQTSLVVSVSGNINSNPVRLDFGGNPTPTPTPGGAPQITNLGPTTVLAGEELTINGSGFSTLAADNQVLMTDAQGVEVAALVTAATGSQIKVRVPFGSATGPVRVRTPQGEGQSNNPLTLRTSVSGFVEEAFVQPNGQPGRRPIADITVRAMPPNSAAVTQRTGADGSFVLADMPPGNISIEFDTSTTPLPFPRQLVKLRVFANRDNQFSGPIELQQVSTNAQNSLPTNAGVNGGAMITVNPGGNAPINFGLPNGCQVTSPPNTGTASRLTVALFEPGRAPAALPPGYFSTAIVQVAPFGALMSPGGTLRLPNVDNIPSTVPIKLFRYDQPVTGGGDPDSIGTFIEVGNGQIQNNQISASEFSVGGRVTQTTFYLASPLYPTAKISGRVVTSDGRAATRAIVQTRGQRAFTRGDGSFTLENIPVIKPGDTVMLEVSYLRPDRVVDRTQTGPIAILANANINFSPDITLAGRLTANQPLVIAPPRLTINENQTLDFSFVATSQPAAGQPLQITTAGANFATVLAGSGEQYTLRLSPGGGLAGEYAINIIATAGNGARYQTTVSVRVRRPESNIPTSNDQSLITSAGAARNLTLTGSDPLNRPILLRLIASPANGAIAGDLPNVTYTPRGSFTGVDSFTYRAIINGTAIASEPSVVYVIVR